jgi:hypothetical protein
MTLSLPFIYIVYTPRVLLAAFKSYTKYFERSLSLSFTTFFSLSLFRRRKGFIFLYILLRDLRRYSKLI